MGSVACAKKLLKQGIRDILRISDARMSGTSYGACILHVAPEAALGGPLGLVRDGDIIELDVFERRLELLVDPNDWKDADRNGKHPQPNTQRLCSSIH